MKMLSVCVLLELLLLSGIVCASEDCTDGFVNVSSAVEGTASTNGRQYIFPSITFTCERTITGWTFVGTENGDANSMILPSLRFQVWRLVGSTFNLVGSSNITAPLSVSHTFPSDAMIYTLTVEPIAVQSGDMFGMFILPTTPGDTGNRTISPHFDNSGNSITYFQRPINSPDMDVTSISDSDLGISASPIAPLVSVVFEPSMEPITNVTNTTNTSTTSVISTTTSIAITTSTSSMIQPNVTATDDMTTVPPIATITTVVDATIVTTSTIVDQPPPTTLSTQSMRFTTESTPSTTTTQSTGSPETFPQNAIIGIAVAGVLFLLILILLLVLLLLFVIKGKHGSYHVTHPPVAPNGGFKDYNIDNPNYEDNFIQQNGHQFSVPRAANQDQNYDIPGYTDPTFTPKSTIGNHTTVGVALTSSSIYDNFDDSHYEMDDASKGLIEARSPPKTEGIYEMEPIPNSVTTAALEAAAAHYEFHTSPLVLDKEIYVPTEEERQIAHPPSGALESKQPLDDHIYSQIGMIQRQKHENPSFFEQDDVYWKPANQRSTLYNQLAKRKYREIPRKQIQIIKHLGSGQFGTVNEGVWHSIRGPISVAVKMVSERATEIEKIKLLQEAAIMGQFSHPNVVQLKGVITVGQPIMIAIELMANGDLRNYLKSIRPRSGSTPPANLPLTLLKFCSQVADGVNYLSKKSFIHRDLAARNILLDENLVCKVGDFGMARDLEDDTYYVSEGGKIPIKWTAPEALQYKKYSMASDVWGFAVLMYEIWSMGHKPFEGFSNAQTIDLVQSGYRLPPPPGCPRALYQLMIHCWHPDSSRRPSFAGIVDTLNGDKRMLLSWRELDKSVHPQASHLGTSLEAGQDLYSELQHTFVTNTMQHQ